MPTDPAGLAQAYKTARHRVAGLVAQLDTDELATRVPACPQWTVQDVVAHMVGICVALQDGNYPTGDVDAWNAAEVANRRGRRMADILSEWEERAPGFEAMFSGPFAPAAGNFVADVVTHEIDVRGALGLHRVVVPEVPMAIETFVHLQGAGLDSGDLPGLRLVAGEQEWLSGMAAPGATVRGDPFEVLRAISGRRTHDQIRHLDWEGDAERYLSVFAPYPPPAVPLAD